MSEYEPITGELRRVMNHTTMAGVPLVEIGEYEFGHRCDEIDAVHAGLERENAELRERLAVLDNQSESMHIGSASATITDELMGYASMCDSWERTSLDVIADRIDAEHERVRAESIIDMTDERMAEHGWYRALCADRKPMLLGDRMEWANGTFTIHELRFTEGGCTTWDSEHGYTVNADECHHHAPTVEDVLTEFGIDWEYEDNCEDRAALLAEYAAKLRLAGDAE